MKWHHAADGSLIWAPLEDEPPNKFKKSRDALKARGGRVVTVRLGPSAVRGLERLKAKGLGTTEAINKRLESVK